MGIATYSIPKHRAWSRRGGAAARVATGWIALATLVLAGCAQPPEPVARVDTRLAGYLGDIARTPTSQTNGARQVGVGVLPGDAATSQDETARLAMIAAVREALTGAAARARGIESVRPLADSYLRAGGVDGLRQAGRLFGVDTIVLLSLDQRFRPADAGGPVVIAAAGGERRQSVAAQTVLTVIDISVIRVDTGKAVFSDQVVETLGVDARTWNDVGLRRAARSQGVQSAIMALRGRLNGTLAPAIAARK